MQGFVRGSHHNSMADSNPPEVVHFFLEVTYIGSGEKVIGFLSIPRTTPSQWNILRMAASRGINLPKSDSSLNTATLMYACLRLCSSECVCS
ncbi:unnamed protein product [Protopolystoma xenopodis]|uniref:Uncharacterized protein n=1 Tax=Protopolystoma xenopodis TaxID=117903 RepID=A0A3S5FCM5_9PLAT|nr:unnamed protein product [Protopolystoma xenopodis]